LPYLNKFSAHNFILRDWLALDRTILANERTILSFTRTALVLILAGMTFIRFFGANSWSALGYLTLAVGVILWLTGFRIYLGRKKNYHAYVTELQTEENDEQEKGEKYVPTSLR
jgi:Predicted membrane protein